MGTISHPFVTGVDGNRYECQLRQKYEDINKETVYMFLVEYSGEMLCIKKINDEWVFESGGNYLDSWIKELGDYIDKSES